MAIPFVTLFLHHTGWVSGFETAALDSVLIAVRSDIPGDVVIVGIDEEDYSDPGLFGGRSPLDPLVLREVIDAVAAGRPAVIGVDLDTSSDSFRNFELPPEWPPIVWACDAISVVEDHEEAFEVMKPLGGLEIPPPSTLGIALLPPSFDSVLREYRRFFRTTPHEEALPSFPFALASLAGRMPFSEDKNREDLLLSYVATASDFPSLTVREVLAASKGEGWRSGGPLAGKVVLIGGLYRAARDRHRTPVGPMYGVQLMAQAVDLELKGEGIRQLGHSKLFIVELIAGTILVWVGYRFAPRRALLLSLLLIPLLGILCSLTAFLSLALWADFSIPLLGVVLHELQHSAHESRQRIRELEAELAALRTPRG